MINVIKAIAFALSANIDNVAIGMSYGIKKIKIPITTNLFISILMSVITYITMFIGTEIINLFNMAIISKIGAFTLIAIGIYLSLKEFINKDKKDCKLKDLNLKNIITIVLALSANNIATGIAASMININKIFAFIFTFILSSIMLYIGNNLGRNILNDKLEKYSNIFSSIIIILLGLFQIL